jgi:hypothetical protein
MIIYGSLIWWVKVNQRQVAGKLSSVQRLACLCITGVIRSTPTAAMETLLNLPPIDIFIKGQARMGTYRLKYNDSWRNLEYEHSRITNVITNPILEIGRLYASKIFLLKTI